MKEPKEGKIKWSYLPLPALSGVAKAFEHGAVKHGDKSYLCHNDGERVYFDALIRHLNAWFYESETVDPDSGIDHLSLAGANLVVLLDRQKQVGNCPPYFDIEKVSK